MNQTLMNRNKQMRYENGTSCSLQRCSTINDKVQIQIKELRTLNMQVLVLRTFSFFILFSFFL
jgi:hypothetical protein